MRAIIGKHLLQRLPPIWQRRVRRMVRPAFFGTLRHTVPLSEAWGFDRGTPIDRYYIDHFLDKHRLDIRGRVLEIKDSTYTDRFASGVRERAVLDIDPANTSATIVADLASADHVPGEQFDCFILTQTLHIIYDLRSAIEHAHRLLRPGGVLLVTGPTVSRIIPRYGLQTDYWRFTPRLCTRLFGEVFGVDQVTVSSYGNALTGAAFLMGVAADELTRRELDRPDDYFPVLMGVRAVKRAGEEQS